MNPSISNKTLLDGIVVLDVTQVMAGPFCAMLLCDMGADVIEIEPPGGDWTRNLAGAIGAESPAFNAVNRGKRGVVLDLKRPEAQGGLQAPGADRGRHRRKLSAWGDGAVRPRLREPWPGATRG